MSDHPQFSLPDPDLQIEFSGILERARHQFLQPALLQALAECDVRILDEEVHALVPPAALQIMAGRGLRAELVFAVPHVLRRYPQLLAYYRLILGFSQKQFYTRATGLASYKRAEEGRGLTAEQEASLIALCEALNRAAAFLVASIQASVTTAHLEDLALLTFGPQLRGGRNVSLGGAAIQQTFDVVRDIVGDRASRVEDRLIAFTDSTGRMMEVRFGADPDIEVSSVHHTTGVRTPVLAIEVKGGTDLSNAHNRLGEAEKSHLKAKSRGFTDLWTITNVEGLSHEARLRASPTTTRFFDLVDVIARSGPLYDEFREQLLQKLRLPE